jgi:lactoylglutathione lyase
MIKQQIFISLLFISAGTPLFAQQSDSAKIIHLLKDDYATMKNWDVQKHIANCTPDYLLIEGGEIWTLEREIKNYESNANEVIDRKDYFDIKTVKVFGDVAYDVHTLKSVFTKNNVSRTVVWNESVTFRKVNGAWKIALIHSTRISEIPSASFDHVALLVRNMKASAAFYQTLFHLDTIPVPPHGNTNVVWFKMNRQLQLHLVEGLKDSSHIPFNHIAFSVSSIDEFIDKLKKAGIKYYGGNSQGTGNSKLYGVDLRGDGVHQIYFNDPDGYQVEVNDRRQ